MKKSKIFLVTAMSILSVILFFVLSHFMIISPINQFEQSLSILQERQQIIEKDFEQIYLQKNYTISPDEDRIIVKLIEKNTSIICYYTADKQFINSEVDGIKLCTNRTALIVAWWLVVILSIVLSFVITGVCVGIIDITKNTVRKLKN